MPGKCLVEVVSINGHAIITDKDGKIYTFTPEEGVRGVGKSFSSGMFLQPALSAQIGSPVQTLEIYDEYPFNKITEEISGRVDIHDALRQFLLSLDQKLSPEMRQK